jgi:hypothetical protein
MLNPVGEAKNKYNGHYIHYGVQQRYGTHDIYRKKMSDKKVEKT